MTQSEVFDLLKRKTIEKVNVYFSGGNDSGSVEKYEFILASGDTVSWKDAEIATLHKDLPDSLEKPVWDKYGSFAGEFYAEGHVVWDVKERTVGMKGFEEVRHNETIDEDFTE